MVKELLENLRLSYTGYHAVERAKQALLGSGFAQLDESLPTWKLKKGDKRFVIRDGSALIAFIVGEKPAFNIVASHTDSPALKLKYNSCVVSAGLKKLNVEVYGGTLNYTWFDRPLKLAGRIAVRTEGKVEVKNFVYDKNIVIPSLAVHMNRGVNNGATFNPQVDLQPVFGAEADQLDLPENADYDLFAVCDQAPFFFGASDEFFCSPRIDNLSSVFASLKALDADSVGCTAVAYAADNEEVGSRTKQGAGSTFLYDVLTRICSAMNINYHSAMAGSMMISCDNAHATHPAHPELNDPTNKVVMGGGVVVKHHAGQNYTTDAVSSACFKTIAEKAGAKTQDFFMRADMPCGGTLGAISSSQVSIRSVDIGLPQLAMHSTAECAACQDYCDLVNILKCFYREFSLSESLILK